MNNLVNYVAEGGVALVTLSEPPDNAFTHEMMKELDEAIIEARFDSDVHTVVITGSGERYFSAGASTEMLREVDPAFQYYFFLHANETLIRLENTPKLVMAAINGHCTSGGLELALACDLRIARRSSARLGFPEVNLGVLPAMGGTQRLARLLGKARAMEILLEGELFDLDQALALGLLHRILDVSSQAFLPSVVELACQFGPPRRPPLAVGRIKRAIQSAGEVSLEQGIALERELQLALVSTEDAREGFAASKSRRPPSFSGR